jgi:BCD family chlorophyll transporter-like MFS transporter
MRNAQLTQAGATPSALATAAALGWFEIFRLGLVQASLGAIVVLVTSTLNRVMVVEYALPALLPGVLVALHYAVQVIRPRFGYGSDRGGRRTPWIVGGMAVLAVGGVLCAAATVSIAAAPGPALALAVFAYALVGLGVGSAGTSLLVLMANRVGDRRRAAAATIMWVMMIAGFAITSTLVGHFLDPFSPHRLIRVMSIAAALAFAIAVVAVWRVEDAASSNAESLDQAALANRDARLANRDTRLANRDTRSPAGSGFRIALRRVWSEPEARGFTLFVFVSMLAYSAQELLLEPFAGIVFRYSVGGSAQLSGLQHSAVFLGMIGVGIACSGNRRWGSLRSWTIGGCFASALALFSLAGADWVGPAWPLRLSVFALGASNGVFAVAAIGSMMELAHKGETGSAGVRMGLWGAAQALAFALGGLLGTGIVDSIRYFFGAPVAAFGIVFCVEAMLFLVAGRFASRVGSNKAFGTAADGMVVTV